MCGVVNKKVTGGKLAPCNNHMHELSTARPSVSVLLLKTVRVCVCVCFNKRYTIQFLLSFTISIDCSFLLVLCLTLVDTIYQDTAGL